MDRAIHSSNIRPHHQRMVLLLYTALRRRSHAVAACCEMTFTSLQHRQRQGSFYWPWTKVDFYLTLPFRALWRCGFKSSQASQAAQLLLEFKAPAVCDAAWLELPSISTFQQWYSLTVFFCSPARDVIVVGTADGSLHLINPNSWRRRIRQIQAHKL